MSTKRSFLSDQRSSGVTDRGNLSSGHSNYHRPHKAKLPFPPHLNTDLQSLAQLSSNALDTHSSLIFFPQRVLEAFQSNPSNANHLELVASQSLSQDLAGHCILPLRHGLIGWTAQRKELIHVSPFERDSTTLGVYHRDQNLKSFAACPIFFESSKACVLDEVGVLACDSRKSYAFSEVQLKLLQDLALQISRTVRRYLDQPSSSEQLCWESFCSAAELLCEKHDALALSMVSIQLEEGSQELKSRTLDSGLFPKLDRLKAMLCSSSKHHHAAFQLPNGTFCFLMPKDQATLFSRRVQRILEEYLHGILAKFYRIRQQPLVKNRFSERTLKIALQARFAELID